MTVPVMHERDAHATVNPMFGFGKQPQKTGAKPADDGGPKVSRLCTDKFNGKYPHVGLYDCRERKVWVCKPLDGQAIRTSHAALITGTNDATGTVWKDRFLCFWFFTPTPAAGWCSGIRSSGTRRTSRSASTRSGTTTASD